MGQLFPNCIQWQKKIAIRRVVVLLNLIIAKGLAVSANPFAKSLLTINQITNNLKQICKMNKRMIQMTDAKVRGFWADSKKLARFLSKLLRQGERIATE